MPPCQRGAGDAGKQEGGEAVHKRGGNRAHAAYIGAKNRENTYSTAPIPEGHGITAASVCIRAVSSMVSGRLKEVVPANRSQGTIYQQLSFTASSRQTIKRAFYHAAKRLPPAGKAPPAFERYAPSAPLCFPASVFYPATGKYGR